jgi:hypothetical protein
MLAIPLTRLWRLTRRELIPSITPVGLYDPIGQCGVGNYVNFLDLWTNISFIFFALITFIGLKPAIYAQVTFDDIYLLPVLVSFIITIAFAVRMIINGVRLRENYLLIIQKSFKTLQDKEKDKIGSDPTINFIGDRWWKIPVTLITMMGTAWIIFKWSGISALIEDVVK